MEQNPPEPIFKSGIRTLVKTLFGAVGILLGVAVFGFLFSIGSGKVKHPSHTHVQYAADAKGSRVPLHETAPVILRINMHGTIGMGDLTTEDLRAVLDDSQGASIRAGRVKGLFLDINSPGGSAITSDAIYRLIKEYKETYKVPVYAYVEGMCASGAVYISCAADKILSNPVGIIGSVGVITGPFFNVSDLMQKYGVGEKTITAGKDKNMLSPFRPWKPGEDQSLVNVTDYLYDVFVNIVTESRPAITKQKLVNDYGAHIFSAPKARELGYVDSSDDNYDTALTALVKAAGIGDDESYQVIELTPQRSFVKELLDTRSPLITGKINHTFLDDNPILKEPFLYLYLPR